MRIKDADGREIQLGIDVMSRSLVISSTAFGVPYGKLTQAASAQLWPIIRHYAETGELCETPPVAEDAPTVAGVVAQLRTLFANARSEAEYYRYFYALQHLEGEDKPDVLSRLYTLEINVAALESRKDKHKERMDFLETLLAQHADAYGKLAAQVYTLQQQHAPGHAHRANEPRYSADALCECGHEYDKHSRHPMNRATALPCECCACRNFKSAELRYMDAKQ